MDFVCLTVKSERKYLMSQVQIRLFGNPKIEIDGREVSLPYKKAEALLYYLCIRKSITRDEAVSLLWGDEEENAGKKKLRDAIYQLRKLLGREAIVTTGNTGLALNPKLDMETDYREENPGQGADFLDHFYVKNCYEFEEWAQSIRDSFRAEMSDQVKKNLEQAVDAGDFAAIAEYGGRLLRQDPYDEEQYRKLMNIYAENGNYVMAIRLYNDMKKLFRQELDMEPSRETSELFRRIFNLKEQLPSGGRSADPVFFGRKKELFEVSGLLDQSPEERTNCIVLEGEEGVGKTAFLGCCERLAAGRKMITLTAVCYRQSADFFLSPWNDIVREIFQKTEDGLWRDLLSVQEQKRLEALLSGTEEVEASGRERYQRIESAIVRIFQKLGAEHRVFLSFDEMQWMDEISFQLLTKLVCTVPADRLKVVATYDRKSDGTMMQQIETLVRQDRIRFLTLEPFSEAEMDEILHRALPELDQEPDKRHRIYEITEGNAFFLSEMIQSIRDHGFTLEKTPRIRSVLDAKMAGVSRTQREVLECLSIFPGKISIDVLELLLKGMDRLSLLRVLEELQDLGLIQETLVGWEVYYQYVHSMYRDHIAERMSSGKKLLYHRMLAEYYEKQGGGIAVMPLIAYHYLQCHDEVKGYGYQIQYLQEFYTIINENFPIIHSEVADLGDEFGIMAEAEKMLGLAENVIRMKETTPEVARMKMNMFYILGRHDIAAGEYDTGLDALEQSMELAEGLRDQKMILACLKQKVFYGIQTGDVGKVEQYVNQGLNRVTEEQKDEYATFLRLKGWYRVHSGDYDGARETLHRAVEQFRSLQQGEKDRRYAASIAACYDYEGDIYRNQGQYDEALHYYMEAIRLGQDPVTTNGMAQIHSNVGQVRYLQKRYGESYIYLDRARETLERSGYRWGLERTEIYLAMLCLDTGKPEEARMHFAHGKLLSEKIRNPQTEELVRKVERRLADHI